jgi:hypothetical protein
MDVREAGERAVEASCACLPSEIAGETQASTDRGALGAAPGSDDLLVRII